MSKKSKSSSISSNVGYYLNASSGSSTSSQASYPDSITSKNLPTITSKLSSMKSSTVDSHPYYSQALSEIQGISKSIGTSLKDPCTSKYSDRNKIYKKMIYALLNKLRKMNNFINIHTIRSSHFRASFRSASCARRTFGVLGKGRPRGPGSLTAGTSDVAGEDCYCTSIIYEPAELYRCTVHCTVCNVL